MTRSAAVFEWLFQHNISDFEILFLSQKNPQTLIYVEEGKVVEENTRFKHRIQLINDDYTTVGFKLTNITVADMGIYYLYVPKLLLTSKAILIVTDFAKVPDPEVHRQLGDSIVLSWDLTALRKLRDINHEIFLTTPATGRIHLNYYYTQWLRDNPHRHSVSQPRDHLHPTVIIDDLALKDAGNYVIEVMLTSSVHRLNSSWQFVTDVAVADISSVRSSIDLFVTAVVLGVSLGISIIVVIVLVCVCRSRENDLSQMELETSRLRASISRLEQPRTRSQDNSQQGPTVVTISPPVRLETPADEDYRDENEDLIYEDGTPTRDVVSSAPLMPPPPLPIRPKP